MLGIRIEKDYLSTLSGYYTYWLLEKITGKEKYNIAKYNLKYLELAYILFGLVNILGIIMKYRDFKTFIGFLAILHSNCKKYHSTAEDIYNMLKEIPGLDALNLLGKISPDLAASEQLAHYLQKNDKDNFRKTLLNGEYKFPNIKELCDIYRFGVKMQKNMLYISSKRTDTKIFMLEVENIINELTDIPFKYMFNTTRTSNFTSMGKAAKKDAYSYCENILTFYFMFMEETKNIFLEKNIVNKFIKIIKFTPLYNDMYKKSHAIYSKVIKESLKSKSFSNLANEYLETNHPNILEIISDNFLKTDSNNSPQINHDEISKSDSANLKNAGSSEATMSDSKPDNDDKKVVILQLPDDYFKKPCDMSANVYADILQNCKAATHEVWRFTKLINYIAEQGYIDKDYETMLSFAFHLTRICYPENFQAKEKIKWNKDLNALFCITKNLYYKPRYKQLIKSFIIAPNDYANLAAGSGFAERVSDKEFYKKMYEIYPKYFPIIE